MQCDWAVDVLDVLDVLDHRCKFVLSVLSSRRRGPLRVMPRGAVSSSSSSSSSNDAKQVFLFPSLVAHNNLNLILLQQQHHIHHGIHRIITAGCAAAPPCSVSHPRELPRRPLSWTRGCRPSGRSKWDRMDTPDALASSRSRSINFFIVSPAAIACSPQPAAATPPEHVRVSARGSSTSPALFQLLPRLQHVQTRA